jgi:hypothetical protein
MTPLARATEGIFVVLWFLAAGAWFYGMRYWFRFWRAQRVGDAAAWGHFRQWLKVMGVFTALILLGFVAGAVGNFWAGGWK